MYNKDIRYAWSVTALVAATDTSVRSVAERNASRGMLTWRLANTSARIAACATIRRRAATIIRQKTSSVTIPNWTAGTVVIRIISTDNRFSGLPIKDRILRFSAYTPLRRSIRRSSSTSPGLRSLCSAQAPSGNGSSCCP